MPAHPRSARQAAPGRVRAVPLLLAALACAAGCGDTLVDHEGRRFVSLCQETATNCGVGSACVDCTDAASYTPPANGQAICGAALTCDFECDPGWLRCGSGCCRALSVAAGWYHTCAILGQPGDTSGRLRCWGANDQGQLGDGAFQDSPVPVDVVSLASGVTQVAAGAFHTCAVQNGASYCWGLNAQGQVGAGFTAPAYDYPQPVTNVPPGGFTQLALGGGHTCARSNTGDVWCWGADDLGQLGQGVLGTSFNNKPLRVPSLSGIASVAAGRYHTCALTSGGAVSCWGADDYGQIGDGVLGPFPTGSDVPTPTPIGSPTGVIAIAAGNQFTLAITPGTPDPQLWGWGTNATGELGSTHPPDAISTPTLASAVSVKPTALAAGREHTCAVSGGGLECFGANNRSQLGAPTGSDVVVSFGVASAPVQVAAGFDHTCAILADGSLYCWGSNERGQVGNGLVDLLNPVGTPTLVTGR